MIVNTPHLKCDSFSLHHCRFSSYKCFWRAEWNIELESTQWSLMVIEVDYKHVSITLGPLSCTNTKIPREHFGGRQVRGWVTNAQTIHSLAHTQYTYSQTCAHIYICWMSISVADRRGLCDKLTHHTLSLSHTLNTRTCAHTDIYWVSIWKQTGVG